MNENSTNEEAPISVNPESLLPPPMQPPTAEELERIGKANAELAVIAAAKSEEERKRLMDAEINKKHSYRGEDGDGAVHEFDHMPGIMFKVEIFEHDGSVTVNYCGTGDAVLNIAKSVRRQDKEAKLPERKRNVVPVRRVQQQEAPAA